jgi:hypothetical protein
MNHMEAQPAAQRQRLAARTFTDTLVHGPGLVMIKSLSEGA